jgi:hypothetical protein
MPRFNARNGHGRSPSVIWEIGREGLLEEAAEEGECA